jgi:uncharacterized protein YbaR (Trm112 family)
MPTELDGWVLEHLACPTHHEALVAEGRMLACPRGCHYPVIDGIPVMLLQHEPQTIELARATVRLSREDAADGDLYLDTLGLSEAQRRGVAELVATRPDDCFFGLGLQYGDRKLFTWPVRFLALLSETLRRISDRLTLLVYGADSLYLHSKKGIDR